MATHVKPAIKKLEKGGVIDKISTQLLDKVTANETAIAELKISAEAANGANNTLHLDLNEDEVDEIARHVQSLLHADKSLLASVKTSIKNTERELQALARTESEARDRLLKIEEQITNFVTQDDLKTLKPQPTKQTTPTKTSYISKSKYEPAEHQTLNHDVIIIGDSNTREIDMGTIGRGMSRKRHTCYTIPHVINFINTANIVTPPKKVVLHIGTNDVRLGNDIEQLRSNYNELIQLARTKFPTARIYISSVFCRMKKDDKLNEVIAVLNEHLCEYCDITPLFTLIDNSNIHHKDMKDPLHVNATGFHTFICNLRVTVFGEKHNSRRR